MCVCQHEHVMLSRGQLTAVPFLRWVSCRIISAETHPALIAGSSVLGLWRTEWQWHFVVLEFFGFAVSLIVPYCFAVSLIVPYCFAVSLIVPYCFTVSLIVPYCSIFVCGPGGGQ